MPRVEIRATSRCPFRHKAKALLRARGLSFEEIDVTSDGAREREMTERSGRSTVPAIFLDGRLVGGHDDIVRLEATGEIAGKAQATRLPSIRGAA